MKRQITGHRADVHSGPKHSQVARARFRFDAHFQIRYLLISLVMSLRNVPRFTIVILEVCSCNDQSDSD